MKLVSYEHRGAIHYGAVKNGRVVDLTDRIGKKYPTIVDFIAGDGLPIADSIIADQPGDFAYEELTLVPVVPNPSRIICVGLNYHDHISEANRQLDRTDKGFERPMIFARWPESLTAHRQPIFRPKVSTQLDYEAELLAVIGKDTGRYVPEEKALEYVFGYSCLNEACVTTSGTAGRSIRARISRRPAQPGRGW
jgi:2-keto-4-pentenoate hydratase/2-oxohepta-3-ene-1,7-dioic acid hydratase in catechol pathway